MRAGWVVRWSELSDGGKRVDENYLPTEVRQRLGADLWIAAEDNRSDANMRIHEATIGVKRLDSNGPHA